MKKLDLKKVLSRVLAIALVVGVGWVVTSKIQEGNLKDKAYEKVGSTRRLKPVSAKDAKLSVYGETLPEGVKIKASDVNFEIITDSFSGEKIISFEAARASVLKESDVAFAYDIDLKHQLKAGEEVEVTIDNLKINNPSTFMVLHIKDNGQKEFITPTYVDYTKVKFKTTSFSFYLGYDSTPMELVVTVPAGQIINLPLTGTTDVVIDWGDGTIEGPLTSEKPGHTYSTVGTYTIQIAGKATTFGTTGEIEDGTNLKDYLTSINSLGDLSCARYGFYNYKFTSVNAGEGSNLYIATDLSNMFNSCSELITIDFTYANTTNATNMSNMFKNCTVLEKIYVGSEWSNSKVINSSNMFYNVPNLEGGYGTAYDINNITASYAVVDSKNAPGYLSSKNVYQLFKGATVFGNYETLKDAITAVNSIDSEDVIELVMLADKIETEPVILANGKMLVFDLGDNTLRIDSDNILTINGMIILISENGGMILNAEKAFVGRKGSTINLQDVLIETSASAIFTKGNLNLTGSNITTTNGDAITLDATGSLIAMNTSVIANGSAISTTNTWDSAITLNSGVYKSTSSDFVVNLDGFGKLTLGNSANEMTLDNPVIIGQNGIRYDGTIDMYDGVIKATETVLDGTISEKPDGYVVISGTEIINTNEYKTIFLETAGYQIDSSYYGTLENAINNAESGVTIKVNKDVVDSSAPNVPLDKDITLDTNGKIIELNLNRLEVFGGLEIIGKGTIETHSAIPAIANSGTLEISDNVTITGGTHGIYNFGEGYIHLKDSTVESIIGDDKSDSYGIYNEGSIYIENSKITSTTLKSKTYGIYTKGECVIIASEISGRLLEETTGGIAYGVYNVNGKTIVGRNDAIISSDTPYIYGTVEGLRNVEGTVEFYDGLIDGYLYSSIVSAEVTTLSGYAVVKTIVGEREYATVGIDTEGPTIKFTKDPIARWTNDKVVVTLEVFDEKTGVKAVTLDSVEVKLENGVGTIAVTQNGTYTVKAEDNAGNIATEIVEIKNIDKTVPIIYSVTPVEMSEKGEAVVKLAVEDGESGINGYAINTKTDIPTEWKTVTTTTEMSNLNVSFGENGEYYIFVRDVAGNISRHSSIVKIVSVDSSEPEIKSVKVENASGGFVDSAMVVLTINATDDIGVTELLISNELLTLKEVADSEDWLPYTEEVLWRIPEEDKEHVVYVWARDAVGRTSSYGMVKMKLLTQYIGNSGINKTSFKILSQDNNYNYDNVLEENDIRIVVKDLSGNITYDGVYGGNITLKGEPVIYGPMKQGTEVVAGRYYTIIAENILGNGTIYLGIKTDAERDKAGNNLGEGSEYFIATDVIADNAVPKITVTSTEVQVKDDDGNGTGYIKVNDKTVKLSSGKISKQELLTKYEIELVTGIVIEASDKCGNTSTYTVY